MTDRGIDAFGFARRLATFVGSLNGRRRAGFAFAMGGLSVAAFAPIFAWPVLFATFAILFWLIDTSPDWRTAAKNGWWFGFGYFFFSLFWIGEAFLVEAEKFAVLLPLAVTLLPAGLALFWAAAAGIARALWPSGLARLFVFAAVFAIAEWLRGHVLTGLPWNLVGYGLTYPLALMQSAGVIGVYGLTAIALLLFPAPLVMLADAGFQPSRSAAVRAVAAALVPLAVLYGYGATRLAESISSVAGVKLRIVQPSVPQREKWMAEHQRRIFEDHLTLSVTNAEGVRDGAAGITHIVWPEAAMPFLPLEHAEAMQAIAAMLPAGVPLITGALRREANAPDGTPLPIPDRPLYNGILVFDSDGALAARYDKAHLVPFGEYLPMAPLLTAIGLKKLTHGQGAFAAGATPRPLIAIPGLPPALGLVCYEALFPGFIEAGGVRPGLVVNVTNDGWFGNTSGPRQHFHQTRVRAVEEGLPFIRAANNGISAIIDPYGRADAVLGLDVRGVVDGTLPASIGPTPYARFGDVMLAVILALYTLAAFGLTRTQARSPR